MGGLGERKVGIAWPRFDRTARRFSVAIALNGSSTEHDEAWAGEK